MFLISILIIFAAVSYFKPTVAVGLILALLPSYLIRFSAHRIPTTFLELLVLVFLVITFAANIKNLPGLKTLGQFNWLILTFTVAGIISALISPEKKVALGILKAFIIEPILFFYALRLVINKPSDLKVPISLLFASAILISLFGIIQYYTLMWLPLQFWGTGAEVERITSIFDYPNALALYLAPLCSFFFAAYIFDEEIFKRKNLIAGLIIMLIALTMTFSRGAWLGFGVSAIVILILRYPIKKVALYSLPILLVVALLPFTQSRLALIAHDESSSAHSQLMAAAVAKIGDSPVFGNGLGGFRDTLAKQNFPGEILNYPHNIVLNFWVEMGILGLLSFTGIIFYSMRQYKLHPSWYSVAAVAFLVTIIIHGLVDVPYFKNDLSLAFWFIVSIFFI